VRLRNVQALALFQRSPRRDFAGEGVAPYVLYLQCDVAVVDIDEMALLDDLQGAEVVEGDLAGAGAGFGLHQGDALAALELERGLQAAYADAVAFEVLQNEDVAAQFAVELAHQLHPGGVLGVGAVREVQAHGVEAGVVEAAQQGRAGAGRAEGGQYLGPGAAGRFGHALILQIKQPP